MIKLHPRSTVKEARQIPLWTIVQRDPARYMYTQGPVETLDGCGDLRLHAVPRATAHNVREVGPVR